LEAEVDGNYKSQNPNNKKIPMTEIRNPKPSHHLKKKNSQYVWVVEYWNLRFICDLVLGIWDFGRHGERLNFRFQIADWGRHRVWSVGQEA